MNLFFCEGCIWLWDLLRFFYNSLCVYIYIYIFNQGECLMRMSLVTCMTTALERPLFQIPDMWNRLFSIWRIKWFIELFRWAWNACIWYFSFFGWQEIIQEQITRVLLERLIVNRPHPWGLLITFIELIKVKHTSEYCLVWSELTASFFCRLIQCILQNPRYNFWNRSFIRCAPEIEKLFESVARSCGGLKPMDDSMVSSWVSESAHWRVLIMHYASLNFSNYKLVCD
jgi:hypothetical protein